MMVWGSMVSMDALAGATSVLKVEPVTTTVSMSPVRVSLTRLWSLAAICCAKAEVAQRALSAAADSKRRLMVFADIKSPVGKKIALRMGQQAALAESRVSRNRLTR